MEQPEKSPSRKESSQKLNKRLSKGAKSRLARINMMVKAFATPLEQGLGAEVIELLNVNRIDGMTQTAGGTWGRTLIDAVLARSRKLHQNVVVVMVDCNGLKKINDKYLHVAGDHYIGSVGKLLASKLPPSAFVVRWGGDEFMCAIPNANAIEVTGILERVNRGLRLIGKDRKYKVSFGVVRRWQHEGIQHVLTRADDKMYKQKHFGAGLQKSERQGV